MLLPRTARATLRAGPRRRPPCARRYSDAPPAAYPPKVRAFPFALSPEQAVVRAALPGVIFHLGPSYPKLLGGAVLAHLGLPGGQVTQPSRMQAAYLPAWVVDGDVEAWGWVQSPVDGTSNLRAVTVHFYKSFMPGLTMEPLSRMAFSDLTTDENLNLAIPFSEDMTRQHDTDILCIPYSVTPFSIPSALQTLLEQKAILSDDIKFNPSTVQSKVMAAYPVLVPVYIMQYEILSFDQKQSSYTVIVEAAREKGQVIVENASNVQAELAEKSVRSGFAKNAVRDLVEMIGDRDFLTILPYWTGPNDWSYPFTDPQIVYGPVEMAGTPLQEWIERRATERGAMARYKQLQAALGDTVDFGDLRVRDLEDAKQFRLYLKLTNAVGENRRSATRQRFFLRFGEPRDKVRSGKVEAFSNKTGVSRTGDAKEMSDSIQQSLEQMEKVCEAAKPDWLKEWEAKHDKSSKSTKGR